MADLDDYRLGDDYAAATQHFAGPFCGCGDQRPGLRLADRDLREQRLLTTPPYLRRRT